MLEWPVASHPGVAWEEPTSEWFPPNATPVIRGVQPSAGPLPGLDHQLVRDVRRDVAEQLAVHLQAEPLPDPQTRRELGRALVADVLARHAVQGVHAGQPPRSVDEEYQLA